MFIKYLGNRHHFIIHNQAKYNIFSLNIKVQQDTIFHFLWPTYFGIKVCNSTTKSSSSHLRSMGCCRRWFPQQQTTDEVRQLETDRSSNQP